MTDQQIFSGSSLQTFLRCAKQWEYAYVYEYKRPPALRQVLGNAAHTAVETNYTQKVETRQDLPVDSVKDVFSDTFDALVVDAIIDEEAAETPGQAKDSGIKVIDRYQSEVAPAIQPIWVEREVQFQIDDIPYSGTIDLVDELSRVRDLKTTKRRPSGPNNYLIAMTGYALAFRQETGEKESEIVLDYMVRTKDPYYYPIYSDGPVSDDAIETFVGIVEMVNQAIKEGIFLPTGLTNYACSWCGYNDICPAYRKTR
jgi:hypothetical protein